MEEATAGRMAGCRRRRADLRAARFLRTLMFLYRCFAVCGLPDGGVPPFSAAPRTESEIVAARTLAATKAGRTLEGKRCCMTRRLLTVEYPVRTHGRVRRSAAMNCSQCQPGRLQPCSRSCGMAA